MLSTKYNTFQEHQDVLDVLIERARKDVLAFTILTKEDYQLNWHHIELSKKLNAFARGEIQYLMVFMPPRHGKSELVSRRFPAFLHGLYPDCEIMAASYLDSLAGDMCMDVQKIIDSPEYQLVFPETKIYPIRTNYSHGTRNSSEHSIVGRKGKYRGQGVGGSFTGKGANFIIIDDPIKGREIADSVAFRERLWNFYNNDLFSRLETNLETGRQGQVLITQTRWHADDLSGRLIELMGKDPQAVQWDIVNYPAIRVDIDDPSDRRQIGDALWPAKYNLQQLDQIKASAGPRAWGSLYQQSPTEDGGNIFNEGMFEFAELPSFFDWSFCVADTSYKEKQENDFTVFTSFGVIGDTLFVRDVWMKQIKAVDVEKPAEAFLRQFTQTYGYRGTYIEPKGHGIYLNQLFSTKNLVIPHEDMLNEFFKDRRFDKSERANNVVPHLGNRKVIINKAIGNKEELVNQCLGFPKVKHDDFCFAAGTKIATLSGNKNIEDIKAGDYVLTPFGLSRVTDSKQTGVCEVITKLGLTSTPSHKVFSTLDNLFVPMDTLMDESSLSRLSLGSMIKWKYQKLLSSMASSTISYRRESIILAHHQQLSEENPLKDFMLRCGNFISDKQFLRATKFIMSMAITLITISLIWSVYRATNILRNIVKNTLKEVALLSSLNILKLLGLKPLFGINQMKVESGIATMQRLAPTRFSTIENSPALYAPLILSAKSPLPCTVVLDAKEYPQGKKPNKEKVYNLTTEIGVYYANGILASNCDTLIDGLKMVYARDVGILDVL